jgi:diphosphomevalonate decarboxylase
VKREASATAHPNIALAKYWGKRPGGANLPAVPSLSVTLAGMETHTRVSFLPGLSRDRLVLGGKDEEGRPLVRATLMLDRVRELSGLSTFAEIVSRNDFPTASGLASSASGFAALAFAALGAAGLAPDGADAAFRERASDLARRASVSAGRSAFGGFVELAAGPAHPEQGMSGDRLVARPLAAPRAFEESLRVLVAVATEGAKAVSSTDGMGRTAKESPYYAAWLEEAPRLHRGLREAVLGGDFEAMGMLAEASALAMHASAVAAGVVYWNGVTLELMRAVREIRARGTAVFFTIDAGPHVKVLARESDAPAALTYLRGVPGVVRVIETRPGRGAELRLESEGARASSALAGEAVS